MPVTDIFSNLHSLPEIITHHAKIRPEKTALNYKSQGTYTPITYQSLYDQITQAASGLKHIGIEPGDKIAIISNNCPEWVIADMATLMNGAVIVPIYPTSSKEDIQFILNNSKAKLVFVQNQALLNKILAIFEQCPSLTKGIFHFEPCLYSESYIHSFESLNNSVNTSFEKLTRDHLASIVYTSGTTGDPKGVMLTHGNFLSNVEGILTALPSMDDTITVLSFLPLSHAFERTAGYYAILALGGSIYYAESIETVSQNIKEVKPKVLISVPRLYEKIQTKILSQLTGIKKPIFHWALNVGKAYHHAKKQNTLSILQKSTHAIANRLVFRKIKENTGGNLDFFVSGGAPLSKELGEFFEALGLIIIEGYGMTESSPVIACNRLESYKFGTVGLALKNVEVTLTKEGELCARGPSIMTRYFERDSDTQKTIDSSGWLHTGDIATINEQGFISIIDRKKEIIVLSNGKNIAPLPIESKLNQSHYIEQTMVLGDRKSYLTALIVPNAEKLTAFATQLKLTPNETASLLTHPQVLRFFKDQIDKQCASFSAYQTVKKFTLLPSEFTQESGELTPTLKLKRKVIQKKYDNIIHKMYD
ncbi:MAG: long-chain fatty acid--CoA ligase [Candidatus Margulisbacteria bacterium]|nr:long-chain fatty acid--CoA ligase [Candidatus Margulisiibacteriota bacterium]